MSRSAAPIRASLGLIAVVFATPSPAADAPGVDAKAAFERVKSLAGEWTTDAVPGHKNLVTYRVTSNGSVVMETLFAGTDHEMVSMYYLDGDDLKMTHYCAMKNQPRVKLDRAGSTRDSYSFVFDGGSNLDPAKDMHMHSGRIRFEDGGVVKSEWDAYKGGKKAGTNTLVLKRK